MDFLAFNFLRTFPTAVDTKLGLGLQLKIPSHTKKRVFQSYQIIRDRKVSCWSSLLSFLGILMLQNEVT